jgi:hypothetical protein
VKPKEITITDKKPKETKDVSIYFLYDKYKLHFDKKNVLYDLA